MSKYEGPERRSTQPLFRDGVTTADLIAIGTSVITALGIGGPLLVWGGKMDARMEAVETRQERSERLQAQLDAKQDAERDAFRVIIRGEIKDINAKLDRLIESLPNRGR